MAQKVNPIAVRLKFNRNSDSSWFSDYYYATLMYQDCNVVNYFSTIRQPTGNKLGFRPGRCVLHHYPKRSVIHLFCLGSQQKSLKHAPKYSYDNLIPFVVKHKKALLQENCRAEALPEARSLRPNGGCASIEEAKPPRVPLSHRKSSELQEGLPSLPSLRASVLGLKESSASNSGFLHDAFFDTSAVISIDNRGATRSNDNTKQGSTLTPLELHVQHNSRRGRSFSHLVEQRCAAPAVLMGNAVLGPTLYAVRDDSKKKARARKSSGVTLVPQASSHLSTKHTLVRSEQPVVALEELFHISGWTSTALKVADAPYSWQVSAEARQSVGTQKWRVGSSSSKKVRSTKKAAEHSMLGSSEFSMLHLEKHSDKSCVPTGDSQSRSAPHRQRGPYNSANALLPSALRIGEGRPSEFGVGDAEGVTNSSRAAHLVSAVLPSAKAAFSGAAHPASAAHLSEPLRAFGFGQSESEASPKSKLVQSTEWEHSLESTSERKTLTLQEESSTASQKAAYRSNVGSVCLKWFVMQYCFQLNTHCDVNETIQYIQPKGIKAKYLQLCLAKSRHYYLSNIQTILSSQSNTLTSIIPMKVTSVYQSASLVAQEICCKLEQTKSFRQICRTIFKQIEMCNYIKGIRIACSGRLNGAEIAKTECKQYGETSLHVFSDQIDYAYTKASTPYGILGVKVWICYL